MRVFESIETRFCPAFIRAQVSCFDVDRFKAEMTGFVAEKMAEFRCAGEELRRRVSV